MLDQGAFRFSTRRLQADQFDPVAGVAGHGPSVPLGDQITQIDPSSVVRLAGTHGVGLAHKLHPSKVAWGGWASVSQAAIFSLEWRAWMRQGDSETQAPSLQGIEGANDPPDGSAHPSSGLRTRLPGLALTWV